MGHAHGHAGGTSRALTIALVLNAAFLLVEAALGWWTNSLALLSDAAHMLSDVAALMLALVAARLSAREGGADKTFGWRRIEVVAAFANGLFMLAICAFIVVEAVQRMSKGAPSVAPLPVLLAGVIGLGINLGSAWFLHKEADHRDLNARGALLHMLSDALGSVGAIVSAVALWAGYPVADPLVSFFIAGLVLVSTASLLRKSLAILLEFAPSDLNVQDIEKALAEIDGVTGVHDLHLWSIDGKTPLLTAHLVSPCPSQALRRAAEVILRQHGIEHSTLQLEEQPCASPCSFQGDEVHDRGPTSA